MSVAPKLDPAFEGPILEGKGAAQRIARLRQRFRLASTWERRRRVARMGRALMVAYWIGCLAVIGVGLDRLYPQWRLNLIAAVKGPAVARGEAWPLRGGWAMQPFPNCSAAHAAGVYNIPRGSPAYRARQDGDSDGFACEPAMGGPGPWGW